MKAVSGTQMHELDQRTIRECGISGEHLMNTAGLLAGGLVSLHHTAKLCTQVSSPLEQLSAQLQREAPADLTLLQQGMEVWQQSLPYLSSVLFNKAKNAFARPGRRKRRTVPGGGLFEGGGRRRGAGGGAGRFVAAFAAWAI